ncbi:hypothetical protein J2P12_04215 [Candidatus Bathyarchaeota archaeon]|nr:hypothetical protein [Candidatus Bathyarchaeota archaeon]
MRSSSARYEIQLFSQVGQNPRFRVNFLRWSGLTPDDFTLNAEVYTIYDEWTALDLRPATSSGIGGETIDAIQPQQPDPQSTQTQQQFQTPPQGPQSELLVSKLITPRTGQEPGLLSACQTAPQRGPAFLGSVFWLVSFDYVVQVLQVRNGPWTRDVINA